METVVINWGYFTGYSSVRSSQPSHMKDGTVECPLFLFFLNFGSRAWRQTMLTLVSWVAALYNGDITAHFGSIIMRGKVSVRCQLKGHMIT